MKVLILYPKFYVYGGAEIVIVRLCNFMTANGIGNAIMTTQSMPEVERQLTGTEMIIVPNLRRDRARHNADIVRGEIEAFARGLRERIGDFDVINPHNYPAEISAMRAGRPSVWMCNEPELHLTIRNPILKKAHYTERYYLTYLYWLERIFIKRKIDSWVVSDQYNADRFFSIYGAKPAIINYGIEYEFFSQDPGQPDIDRSRFEGRFIILHVGMVTPLKNQMASVRALAAVRDSVPGALLVLAGSEGEESYCRELRAFISDNGLAEDVVFSGHVDRQRLRQLYYLSHVMVHPVHSQGGWLSPFEMLSAGKPIIVSPELTASSIILREKIGVVTDDYAAGIIDIYRNYPRHEENARRGRDFVRDNLTWNSFCRKMVDLFHAVMAKNRRSGAWR